MQIQDLTEKYIYIYIDVIFRHHPGETRNNPSAPEKKKIEAETGTT